MKLIKQILYTGTIFLALIAFAGSAFAQQDPMYTQYMDNLLIVNPGFAGSKENGSIMLVARDQWVSFDNAPTTQSFTYNTPVYDSNVGLGFSVLADKIGPLKQTGFYFDYSYFLKVGMNYKLGMGIKGGFSFYRASLTDLQTISPDPIYSEDIFKNFLPNFGVGAFLFSDDTYFGLSVPKLVENSITRDNYSTNYISKEEIHIYMVAGKKFKFGENINLKTYSMLRLVKNVPISVDVTALVGFKEKFWVGSMYRFGDSFGILTQFNITQKMVIGYSYDFTFSELNAFSNGTHEIMFSHEFDLFNKK